MFALMTGSTMAGGALPVALPIVLGAPGVALVLGAVVAIAAGALGIANARAGRARTPVRNGRQRRERSLALVVRRAVTP